VYGYKTSICQLSASVIAEMVVKLKPKCQSVEQRKNKGGILIPHVICVTILGILIPHVICVTILIVICVSSGISDRGLLNPEIQGHNCQLGAGLADGRPKTHPSKVAARRGLVGHTGLS
jgi:hypothetical protein